LRTFAAILLALLLTFGASYWGLKAKHYPPGVLVAREPRQSAIIPSEGAQKTPGLWQAGFELQPRASIALEGRVLHCRHYKRDEFAGLMPYDIAVGWGPMSDQAVLDRLRITQANRFFFYEYQLPAPLSPADLAAHATNLHLIASTPALADRIARTCTGDLVLISGLLVDVRKPGGPLIRTSLSRTDSGPGACEIIWVDDFQNLPPITPPGTGADEVKLR
jgi:hypothetical protein